MFTNTDITENEDGSCDIFCDTPEKSSTIQALFRNYIDVENDEDAIFSQTPPSERKQGEPIEEKPVISIITVRAPLSDIVFALDSAQKMVRPYPKNKTEI